MEDKHSAKEIAKKTWEMENDVTERDILKFNEEENDKLFDTRPWLKDPHYFKDVKISVTALIKMVTHCRRGGDIEVMGLMQGKVIGTSFYVLDAFGLPVEGTETRVNAGAEANEYLGDYMEVCEDVGRLENICGWYHSHPGYAPWLSGIDVGTQSLYQAHQEPFVAIVIDPKRTISSGKVDIGCFRTYPEDYKGKGSEFESVPMEKIEDFGAHANRYYKLEHSIFKSELDQSQFEFLWNQYWVQTLSTSSLLLCKEAVANTITDISEKVHKYKNNPMLMRRDKLVGYTTGRGERGGEAPKKDNEIAKINKGTTKMVLDNSHMLMSEVLKSMIFSHIECNDEEAKKDVEMEK
ncbi:unnamed protein product [Moneuplotes crassus]|uniref:MPN domain-containing protein n=1 Tax=Euplotes crassus TaxID=5936 RepID=A0AAD1XKG8_EUPCR|nr:unnamed protein product [Moneuplotes crassus]